MSKFRVFIWEKVILKLGDFLTGSEVMYQLKIQRKYNYFNNDELEKNQIKKLSEILNHSITTCKAYKNIENLNCDGLTLLKKFPIINKHDLVKNCDYFLSNKFKKEKLIKYETSGSSGIRTVVYVDKKEQSIFRAILINWWEWNGYRFGSPIFQTGISPKRGFLKTIKDFLFSTIYIDAFSIGEEEIVRKLKSIKSRTDYFLFGYASSLYVIAQIAKKHNINVKFKMAMSQGDKLFDHYKLLIEEVFKTQVVEDYGCNEGIMVGQKKDLPFYYLYSPSVYMEILNDSDLPVNDGEIGRVIITKLDGYAMPLIRYDTGDLAIMLPKYKYPQKRDLGFPLIEKVIGRNTDIIKTPEGNTLIVHTFTGIFEFYKEIYQFQIVQEKTDEITINYIKSDSYNSQILPIIERDIKSKAKTNMRINWSNVNKIEPSKSGKPQLIINRLVGQSLSDII